MDKENQFSQGKLFPLILKYSIPAAISLLITAIYNIVDRIFVGNFNGTSALAGLSICFPLSYKRCAESILDGCSYLCLWVVKRVQSDKPLTLSNHYGECHAVGGLKALILWLYERKTKEGKGFILIPPKIAFYCVTKQVACLRSLWVLNG